MQCPQDCRSKIQGRSSRCPPPVSMPARSHMNEYPYLYPNDSDASHSHSASLVPRQSTHTLALLVCQLTTTIAAKVGIFAIIPSPCFIVVSHPVLLADVDAVFGSRYEILLASGPISRALDFQNPWVFLVLCISLHVVSQSKSHW